MNKYVRFKEMTVVIPLKDNETKEEVESKLLDALDSAGARFSTYIPEIVEDEDK